TVIAILGLLASIATAAFSTPKASYEKARARRNAQQIATEYNCARAAGLNFTVESDVLATARNVVRGGIATSGAFRGREFKVAGIEIEDVEEAANFLVIHDGELIFQH
ncbi:MAG: hypothetical protein KDK97_22315, partial [Verrucomicrobiales bacterium]|nr:hypothetical protein [Verrucomicrobiales bacterium]